MTTSPRKSQAGFVLQSVYKVTCSYDGGVPARLLALDAMFCRTREFLPNNKLKPPRMVIGTILNEFYFDSEDLL